MSDGCRMTAAKARRSSAGLSPSSISTRSRSPRAGTRAGEPEDRSALHEPVGPAGRADPVDADPADELARARLHDQDPAACLRLGGRHGDLERLPAQRRPALPPDLGAGSLQDLGLEALGDLDSGRLSRAGVDQERHPLVPLVEQPEVRQVGPARRQDGGRQHQARQAAALDRDLRLLREQPAQLDRLRPVGPLGSLRPRRLRAQERRARGDRAGQGRDDARPSHALSWGTLRNTKRWYSSDTRISDTASPTSDATRYRSRSAPRSYRNTLPIVTSRQVRLIQRSPSESRAIPKPRRISA